jgi:hypothetical protein
MRQIMAMVKMDKDKTAASILKPQMPTQ